MAFQAVIGPHSLKSFTKTLACLARYGDDVVIQAGPEALLLSATNSSKTAFCRVKLSLQYFDKYKLKPPAQPGMTFQTPPDIEEIQKVTGQLPVKVASGPHSLLSILKHKTLEKTVDRCDLSIVEGGDDSEFNDGDEDEDSLSSKLIVRLHCKHGVVKTHRLLLLTPTEILGPNIQPSPQQSRVIAGPRAIREILEHFPHARGSKSDARLVWQFAMNDTKVKSMGGGKGKSDLATEIAITADEFESYTICDPPVSIAFHLREFNATISLAESLSVALELRFTEPDEPIYIEFDTDASDSQYLFIISTIQGAFDSSSTSKSSGAASLLKRTREDDGESEGSSRAVKKPLKAAIKATSPSPSRAVAGPSRQHAGSTPRATSPSTSSRTPEQRAPLFLPGASQLSAADMDILRDSGLGIEHMDYDEFEAMMDAEGEEVGMSTAVRQDAGDPNLHDGNGEMEDEMQMGPTQVPVGRRQGKEFRPLFDD